MSPEQPKKGILVLCNLQGDEFGRFDNYIKIYHFFMRRERTKNAIETKQVVWNFLILSPQTIADHLDVLRKKYNEQIMLKAWRQQLPIIEICRGDYSTVEQVLLTPDVDTATLRQQFCNEYAAAHNMTIKIFN